MSAISKALRSYTQADTDGVMVTVSRQACDQAATALDGLPDGALDGGWTAAGLSAYAKGLEDELAQLRASLATAQAALKARQVVIDEWVIATDESVRLCGTDTGAWTEEQWQRAEDRVSERVIAAENAITALATPANPQESQP